ncbi:MAG: SpoIIE family protein phosphatase [Oscillospiraceae bacterium]|jgi:serine/threonine protein phosphatase PrpC|nr:SpoIIE family protein phosphatase [Oscillospiraceae bacterium]
MYLKILSKSILGTRDEQQDAYYANSSDGRTFAVVCDGMGGSLGGAAASSTAVTKIRELVSSKKPDETYPMFFIRVIDILDEEIVMLQKQKNTKGAGTTIVAVIIENKELHWLSVGDSRLYIIRQNEIAKVTRDHNYALSLEHFYNDEHNSSVILKEEQRKDALISFIGIGGVKIFDVNNTAFSLIDNDIILLTTDGLTNLVNDDEIYQILINENINSSFEKLFELAESRANGVQDNTTCVLIKVINTNNLI